MENANSEIGKGLIAFANLLMTLIFLQPYINNKVKLSEVLIGVLLWFLIYIFGWLLNFKENKNGS